MHTLVESGIIKFSLHENTEWYLEDAIEAHQANMQLARREKFCVYMCSSRLFLPSKEAQAYASSKACTDYRIAAAHVPHSIAMKLMADIFILFSRKKSPARVFYNEEDALAWLRKEYKKAAAA